ncbi:uncharacterized protein A4U43_C04F18070, partial [Asparagus officinalis]
MGILPENKFKQRGRCSRRRSREELSKSHGRRSCPDLVVAAVAWSKELSRSRGHGGFVVATDLVVESLEGRRGLEGPQILVSRMGSLY